MGETGPMGVEGPTVNKYNNKDVKGLILIDLFRDLEANLEPLEPKEKEEKEVKPEAKVPKVIVVFSVFKVFLVLWYVNMLI